MNIEQIAKVCHETNKAYCETIGDTTQKDWWHAEPWQRDSAMKGVEFALANPNAPASAQHEAWLRDKEKDGWKYGTIKDAVKKEHPCYVPYDELPIEQKIKDYLFKHVVRAFIEASVTRKKGNDETSV
jgi:RyR domain